MTDTEPAEPDRPPITVADIIELAKRAAPESVIVGGYRIRYVDEFTLADWTPHDPDSEPE